MRYKRRSPTVFCNPGVAEGTESKEKLQGEEEEREIVTFSFLERDEYAIRDIFVLLEQALPRYATYVPDRILCPYRKPLDTRTQEGDGRERWDSCGKFRQGRGNKEG